MCSLWGDSMDFLDIFDLLRASVGALVCCLLFIEGMFPKRKDFTRRAVTGGLLVLLFVFTYVPMTWLLSRLAVSWPTMIYYALFYEAVAFLIIWLCWFCYEITLMNVLLRGLLGASLEAFLTSLYCYWFIKLLYPNFPTEQPIFYALVTVGVYLLAGLLVRGPLNPFIHRLGIVQGETTRAVVLYVAVYLLFAFSMDLCKAAFEMFLNGVTAADASANTISSIRYCLLELMLFISLTMAATISSSCHLMSLRQENDLLQNMMVEKEKQYRLSQENIAIINQKCHDLKHQISAMAYARPEERSAMIEDAEKAVLIYDSVVQTESEALNTLLTEKSLYCTQHNIRLQCFVNDIHREQLVHINVVDLYTMLGNGLDNAIEHVEPLEEDEHKTIHLSVEEQGGVLMFTIENYNNTPLRLIDGLPATSKQDKSAHGFGLKSIRMIAQKYGGALYILNEDDVFTLRVAIPL